MTKPSKTNPFTVLACAIDELEPLFEITKDQTYEDWKAACERVFFCPKTMLPDGSLRPTALAVDFDGTLAKNAWPEIGAPNIALITILTIFRKNGGQAILWTCREGDYLEKAVQYCESYGLEFDAVNENLPSWRAMFGNDTRKIGADHYIDDKAVCITA